MSGLLIAILIVVGVCALVVFVVVAFLMSCSATLLSGVATVDVDEVDPALRKEINRLELDYAVAEDLGYGGDILLGIESKLNAAKLAAAASAGYPEASMTILVLPAMVDGQGVSSICGIFGPASTLVPVPNWSVICAPAFVGGSALHLPPDR